MLKMYALVSINVGLAILICTILPFTYESGADEGIQKEIKDALLKKTKKDDDQLFRQLERSPVADYFKKVYSMYLDTKHFHMPTSKSPMVHGVSASTVTFSKGLVSVKFELSKKVKHPILILELVLADVRKMIHPKFANNVLGSKINLQLFNGSTVLMKKNFSLDFNQTTMNCLRVDLSSLINNVRLYHANFVEVSFYLSCSSCQRVSTLYQHNINKSVPTLLIYHQITPAILDWRYPPANKKLHGFSLQDKRSIKPRGKGPSGKSDACRRVPLTIDFHKVNLKHVIAPQSYEGYMCTGACRFPMTNSLNSTNHAVLQGILASLSTDGKPPPVCCAPFKYSSQRVMYKGGPRDYYIEDWPDMVVESCACR